MADQAKKKTAPKTTKTVAPKAPKTTTPKTTAPKKAAAASSPKGSSVKIQRKPGGRFISRQTLSYFPSQHRTEKKWFLIDAKGKTVGRLAALIANTLRGKNKPTFTPNSDMGDFVVVINTREVVFTGQKWQQKLYRSHSGYYGSMRETTAQDMMKKKPTRVLQHAVKGMIPRTILGNQQFKKLKLYPGAEHPHAAQNLIPLNA